MATVLITGCNRGIGLEICRQYRERGDDVIGVCRTASDALRDTGADVIDGVDVTADDGVAKLVDALGDRQLDIVINNAGILQRDDLDDLDFDGMLEQYRVNTLGPLRVTKALLPNLAANAKVAIVTSRVGSIEDNGSGGNYGYRCSKTAANMVGMNLHHDLSPRGIAVLMLHPGYVATDMTGGGGIPAPESARGIIARMDELGLEQSGTFWHAEGYGLPW
jgi:NAD(P)-dependent dehydrogenase (short-subunit alcohol dehydrogenase family)